jgi:hypothetical protein
MPPCLSRRVLHIPSPREAVGRVGEARSSAMSRGGGRLKISSIKSVTKSPPTPNPSPPRAARVGGRGKANSFSRRMRARAMPTARKLLPSQTKKGGGAPIGARSWGRVLRTRQRALAQSPLASRRSTAALTKVISLGSTPGRASWNYRVQTGGPPRRQCSEHLADRS